MFGVMPRKKAESRFAVYRKSMRSIVTLVRCEWPALSNAEAVKFALLQMRASRRNWDIKLVQRAADEYERMKSQWGDGMAAFWLASVGGSEHTDRTR